MKNLIKKTIKFSYRLINGYGILEFFMDSFAL